jgi:tetratricopeptide (TPR) repeat protein
MGHPRHALALAEAAVEAAGPHADPAVRAYVLAQRALALARTGDRRRTTLDLVEAERCHERGGEAAPGYFARYPRAGLDYQRGEALSALGDTAGAVAAFTASLGGRPDDPRRRTALTRARLADVLLGAGRLDEACSHWAAFLDAYPHLRCAPAEAAVAQLRSALRPYRRASAAAALLAAARSEPRAVPVLPPV